MVRISYPTYDDVALVHSHAIKQAGAGLVVPHLMAGAGIFSFLPALFKVAKEAIPRLLKGDVKGALAHGAAAGITHVLTGGAVTKKKTMSAKSKRQAEIIEAMRNM